MANRVTSLSGGQTVHFGYNISVGDNGLGNRLSQNGVNYTPDLNAGLTQVLNDGTNQYIYGVGRISQVNTTTEYFLGDALNSVRQLTDANGDITLAKSYAPYGEATMSAGNGTSPFAYTGEQADVSGLTYLRARYYSSNAGRFTSRDTWVGNINQPLSMNRWNYVNGNPINYTDPSGYSPNCAIKGTCGPDVTTWFMQEMENHYLYGVDIKNKVSRMKALAHTKLSDPCTNWFVFLSQIALEPPFNQIVNEFYIPTSVAPLGASIIFFPGQADDMIDALAYLEYGLYGLAVDYVNIDYTSPNPACNTGKCASVIKTDLDGNTSNHPTVTLCGQCRDASDFGNMMFGLGGAARGYSLALAYGSATGFNAMTDGPGNLSEFLQVTLFSADGWDAVPGWSIGNGQLFNNRTAFCYWANFPLGRDNHSQLDGCATCNTLYNGRFSSPSSIYKVGRKGYPYGAKNTIEELQRKIENLLE